MKILLVNPPRRRPLRSILPPEVEGERGAFPPLGLLHLAGAVRQVPGVEVRFVDAQAEGLSADDVARRVADFEPDLMGMTVLTFSLLDAMDTAVAVKAARPSTVIIAGGPHPHLYPDETLDLGPFDGLLRGEGEQSFTALVENWPATRETPPPGVRWRGGAVGEPDPAPFIEDLDALPFPARDLSRVELYNSVLSGLRPITTMMSSRGCPHRCIFCDRPHLGKRFRARSAQSVVEEMEQCKQLGIREVIFYDDTFSADRERVRAIAELILERHLDLAWDARMRVSDLKADDYALCRRAGLARVHFGVESGDPEILRALRKGITLDQAREAFKAARRAGLETLAYFMVGLPGETRDTLERTLKLARGLHPDYCHFSVLIPFPGTPIYEQALERGIINGDVWRDFARDPRPDFLPPVWEENLTSEEILAALARMYTGFYRDPRVILRRLSRVRSPGGLINSVRMGLKILFMGEGRQ